MSDCFICVKNQSLKLTNKFSFKSKINSTYNVRQKISIHGDINLYNLPQLTLLTSKQNINTKFKSHAILGQNVVGLKPSKNFKLKGLLNSELSTGSVVRSNSILKNKYVDKFAGNIELLNSINNFVAVQKLYPIQDITTSLNNSYFVNKFLETDNLYNNIDEGLFVGNYNENLNQSDRIANDNVSFIQPSSIFTSGTFRYKCEVTRPYHHPKNNFLFIRAAAPTFNYASDVAPEYRLHNIKLEDPEGNLIARYKDINLKGDADYSKVDITNYATYITEPDINNAALNTWDENYPILYEDSGYTLNIDFDIICLDDPFDQGFNKGYEERACELKFATTDNNDYLSLDGSPLSTHTQGYHLNPTNTIRISAIEIATSGDLCSYCQISGIKQDNYFNLFADVSPTGQRISKKLYPTEISLYDKDVLIYPEEYSLWESSPGYQLNIADNTTTSGCKVLVSKLLNSDPSEYITLIYNENTIDSGRLNIRFGHKPDKEFAGLRGGAFDLSVGLDFDKSSIATVEPVDNFFTIDSLELKIVAKKAIGSPDYAFDVVGYSDDKILNITPKVGAFLQNTEIGTGSIPQVSGFQNIDDLGISSETISDKSAYYTRGLTSIDAGDHYVLSSLPVIDSEEFSEYTIPLSIYEDKVDIGKSTDYSISSFFENLYIDLYPIPSGASISNIQLIVNYKPSNALMLHAFGTTENRNLGSRDLRLLPLGIQNVNDISINNNEIPISYINNIPHGYGEDPTLKTNYSRRWRGVDGNIVNGPYDPNQFDFSFHNPEVDNPFLDGYYNFNNISGNWIISDNYVNSGIYNGSSEIIKNIGLRFIDTQLFPHNTDHTTLDWTENGDPLYGKICDAFDSAIRVSGEYGHINFGSSDITDGFALYIRFTPDYNMSGVDYNLYNSGVIASRWNDGNNLEFTVGFENGYLTANIYDDIGMTITKLQDSKTYENYQYPLSLLLTNINGNVYFYAVNELTNDNNLIASAESVEISNQDNDLTIGYSYGSGIGSNLFIHEVGFSSSGNLVESDPNRFFKQTTIDSFLSSHSHTFDNSSFDKFKLHTYIDEDTSAWRLGAFSICSFSPDFDGFTKRIGKDYLVHYLKHHGSGYTQITNLPLPSNVNVSGVAYHTQIENDFLRFNLEDMPNVNPNFYAVPPRICKTIPRGYDFADKALVVDTIIEHETYNDIIWEDQNIGPKLIVSLYTKNQDPVDRPSKVNWGLVNRSIHYLKPSGCYEKLSSTFNYDDLIDISEPWATYDLENIRSEFDQKYFSKDIDDMFLQYDIVYPSGSEFESKIKIHSANVRLDNSLVYWEDTNNQFNLYSSGEYVSYDYINMFVYGFDSGNNYINLHTFGDEWVHHSGSLNLYMISGIFETNTPLNLFVKNSGQLSSIGPNLYVSGQYLAESSLNLVMIDNTLDQTRYNSVNLYSINRGISNYNDSMNLVFGNVFDDTIDFSSTNSMNLILEVDGVTSIKTEGDMSLYLQSDINYISHSGSLNLFTTNYLSYNQSFGEKAFISWNSENVGSAIDPILDVDVPFLDPDDDIRGVDILCFGDCDNDNSCEELPIQAHNIDWYGDYDCVDGGILRAKRTYTNLDTQGFKTDIGYSGHFYGIRKYGGLVPYAPYSVKLTNKSGSSNYIQLPTEFIETDYGSDEYIAYSGFKFTADKDLGLDERQSGNKYGKSVDVKNDLIAIGAPMQTIFYSEYLDDELVETELEEAGTVYLYRRNERPSGYSWPIDEHKSNWFLEEKLTLPDGLLRDYAISYPLNSINGIQLESIVNENFWNIGQEGRQFGHSLAIGMNEKLKSFEENKKEILVVGAPSAKWSREFEELNAEEVSIGLMVFTDEFTPTVRKEDDPDEFWTYIDILREIENKDLLFTYFSDPPVKFNVKLIICQPLSSNTNAEIYNFLPPGPSFISKQVIPRQSGIEDNTPEVFNGIKNAFDSVFPYDETKLNNNIPVMLGAYVDGSRSMTGSVQPALDQFLSYYQEYSFASGVKDFFGVSSSGAVYYDPNEKQSENWILLSIIALDKMLDTGRLVEDNQTRFFSAGIGVDYYNSNLSEFNHPPASGGRVYVFEKESGVWNLIQEIKQPLDSDKIDRFGHAVSISEDTNIIAIGSPYINNCCQVYEHKPREKEKLFEQLGHWLSHQSSVQGGNSSRYLQLINDYTQWIEEYGFIYASKILYSQLSSTEKFLARKYLNIEEYKNIFTYSYENIPYQGETWSFIPKYFAPSSRLGYSVSVNEDGSLVAFGAPTDSFNAFDDYNVYFKNEGFNDPQNIDSINGFIKPSWRSNVNSGAVRLFESREYYPHNKVVEYGKFGNLHRSINNPDSDNQFDYLSFLYTNDNKEFISMPEDDVVIPEDAGLAFIITPGVDAVSDEIINNIINWLSLGDRNLVLVGNDPTWEASGIYKTSNNIINKILDRLNSRMRIHSARNKQESLPSGNSLVLPSYQPRGGTRSYVEPFALETASGVGNIRMHFPGVRDVLACSDSDPVNNKCTMPIEHLGDLRAEWDGFCYRGDPLKLITYPINWAYKFRTYIPETCLEEGETFMQGTLDLPGRDPVPLLAAASTKKVTKVIPATPPSYLYEPLFEELEIINRGVDYFDTSNVYSETAFIWDSGHQEYNSYLTNINNVVNNDAWFEPPEFINTKGIKQARSSSSDEIIVGSVLITDKPSYCIEDTFLQTSSKIIGIAGVNTESQSSLYSSYNDNNINFYVNLVSINSDGGSRICQLGGWTGRNSFKDAYEYSILAELFTNNGNDVSENVNRATQEYNICWIANPIGLPNEDELNRLKNWLNLGNKRLIITHDSSVQQSIIAKQLFDLLDSDISPIYLPVKDIYPIVDASQLEILDDHYISDGFGVYPIDRFNSIVSYIPFLPVENLKNVLYTTKNITDNTINTTSYFKLNTGVDKISFPAIPGSGYRLFISSISENITENVPIEVFIGNIATQPSLPFPDTSRQSSSILIQEKSTDEPFYINGIGSVVITVPNFNKLETRVIDLQVGSAKPEIDVYINALNSRLPNNNYLAKTNKLISISGVLLPIKTTPPTTTTILVPNGSNVVKISDGQPETTIETTVSGVIKSYNDRYCAGSQCDEYDWSGKLVEDGPVVAAQEIEFISNFNAGVARSRITLITDPDLIQGKSIADEFGRIKYQTAEFIRSLYPDTVFPSRENFGRQYLNATKIVAPERGSPAKYTALNNNQNAGTNVNFGSKNYGGSLFSDFDDKESMYDPSYVVRPSLEPWGTITNTKFIEEMKQEKIKDFIDDEISKYGSPSLSGIINSTTYVDVGISGGLPQIMMDTGYDYLDFDYKPSGFIGDLFGYSVSVSQNKLVVGTPFSAFKDEILHDWLYYYTNNGSGIELSYEGGAGSAYVFEKTFNGVGPRKSQVPWEFIQKLRPNNINVGQDISDTGVSQNYDVLGPNSYTSDYLEEFTRTTDQFGYSLSIKSDVILVGAPGHDFVKIIENIYNSGSFIRKEFTKEFDIPDRIITDLGNSGVRFNIATGLPVLNHGAVFAFENRIDDWSNRTKKWTFVEKILPQGNNTITQNINENDYFGRSIAIDRTSRSDSDYVIIAGFENHSYSISGYDYLSSAGAAYSYDIMLRGLAPVNANPNSYIDAKIFGDKPERNVRLITNNSELDQTFENSGIIFTNINGDIFLEVSGQDPSARGFIQHRPFVSSVKGLYYYGTENNNNMPLFVYGNTKKEQNINLYIDSFIPSSGNVYNNLGLYTSSIVDFDNSTLNLYAYSPNEIASGMPLFLKTSGIAGETLNLRVRGF